jgi:hypothetical protein
LAISVQEFSEFETLVRTDAGQTELKCAKYLHHAAALLVPGTPVNITTGAEDRNYFGSTDFIVSAALLDDQNNEIECAYIWELKAPQAYLFEFDDNGNRCRPTHEFIKAENQLLHYVTQAQADQLFRQRFGILDHRNIRIGGVVIGRSNDRMLRGATNDMDIQKAKFSLSVRENIFYFAHSLRVLTWDRVLSFVKP